MMFFQALVFAAAMEFGLLNGVIANYEKPSRIVSRIETPFYASLEVEARGGVLFGGGRIDTLVWMDKVNNFIPFQATFSTFAGIRIESMSLTFEHVCFHPISPYAPILGSGIAPKYEGGYERIFLRFEM